jgi:hypothetical protein
MTTRADEERAVAAELDALDAGQRHLWCRYCHPEWQARALGAELGAPFTAYCGVRAVILVPSAEDLPPDSCDACREAPRCPECGAP